MSSEDLQDKDKTDRDVILRRRQFLVSRCRSVLRRSTIGVLAGTALAGCPQDPQPPSGGTATPIASVSDTDGGLPTPTTATASANQDPPKIPSLVVPNDVSDVAKGHFERLKQLVPTIHEELRQAEKLTRNLCNIEDKACDGTWTAIAGHLAKARDLERDLDARCGGESEDAKRFEKSLAEHRKVIGTRRTAIQDRIDRAIDSASKTSKWDAHQAAAAIPQPCLKYRCDEW